MTLLLATALMSAVCLHHTACASLLFYQVLGTLVTFLSPLFSVGRATVRSMQGVGRNGRKLSWGKEFMSPAHPVHS